MAGPTNVRKLAGPGVAGMEHDTPLWHFDMETADIPALLSDPAKFLAGTGIPVHEKEEIAFRGPHAVTLCCYSTDEGMLCHSHKV
jgi:hypothetical protein